MKSIKHSLPIIFLILVSAAFTWPFLKPGLPATDDGTSMVIRASAFHQSFKDGHIPTRWLGRLNENFGYPVTNFLYPLPFYLSEIFNFSGFSTLASVKLLFILTTIASSVTIYLWLKPKTSPLPALLGSLIYTLAPYRFADLYRRGSLGESTAFAFIPLVFLFIDRYFSKKKFTDLLLASASLALLILAHNTLAFLFTPIITSYYLLKLFQSKQDRKKLILRSFFFILSSLSLSAFFWLPALHDLQFTRASSVPISTITNHFSTPPQLALAIGGCALAIFAIALIKLKSPLARLMIAFFSISVFMQISATSPLWHVFALDKLVQFPLRFLSIIVFTSAALTALLTHHALKKQSKPLLTILALLVLATSSLSFYRTLFVKHDQFPASFFETNFDTTTNQKEFTPISVQSDPATFAPSPFEIVAGHDEYTVTESISRTQEKFTQIVLNEDLTLIINTHYFPGWTLYVDDNPTDPIIRPDGRIQVELTPGRHQRRDVKLLWQETPIRQLSNTLTIVSGLVVISFLAFKFTNSNYKKTAAAISILIVIITLGQALLLRHRDFAQTFDPVEMKQRYLDSQWVNPDSKHPIGDHGLYSWAGWAYVHGENPILINAEMPPLGKYLIGLGILFTNRPTLVALFFSSVLLLSLYLLSLQVLSDKYLAFIPVALLTTETIFHNSITFTMLDSIQLTFLSLAFLFLIRAKPNPKWFAASALMLGSVLSTKFYAGGVLAIASIGTFYFFTKNFRSLKHFVISLPLAALVHLASYLQYFFLGNSLTDYLGVQKYIFNFYRSGAPSVPFGSYWKLVFFNQWRVWWGPRWGEYYTLTTREWQPTWILNALATLFSTYQYINTLIISWFKSSKIKIADYHLLTSWLIFYSAFLTLIGGWPHYMLLFLPFSNILLVKLFINHQSLIIRKIRSKKHKIRNKFKMLNPNV